MNKEENNNIDHYEVGKIYESKSSEHIFLCLRVVRFEDLLSSHDKHSYPNGLVDFRIIYSKYEKDSDTLKFLISNKTTLAFDADEILNELLTEEIFDYEK
jgi:hypothetical protein